MKKQMIDFPDYYADEYGNVYNKFGHKMSPFVDSVGYYQLNLRKDKKICHVRPHRHIYEAFYGKIPKGMQINHIDGNKLNNKLDNLEIVTNSENTKHGYNNGLYHSVHRNIPIDVYDKNGNYIKTYNSIRQASLDLGINRKTLSSILFNGKSNNYNYEFKARLDTKGQTTIESIAA